MNNFITLVFFAVIGITFASGRIGSDPKTWSPSDAAAAAEPNCEICKTTLRDIKELIQEREPEDFVEIVANLVPEIVCEKVCPQKKKKFLRFW